MSTLSVDFSKLMDAVVETAGVQAGEALREPIAELRQRLSTIERRLAILENVERATHADDALARSAEHICQMCDRRAIARSLCSAHYQQWRYRQKKAKLRGGLLDDLPESADDTVAHGNTHSRQFHA